MWAEFLYVAEVYMSWLQLSSHKVILYPKYWWGRWRTEPISTCCVRARYLPPPKLKYCKRSGRLHGGPTLTCAIIYYYWCTCYVFSRSHTNGLYGAIIPFLEPARWAYSQTPIHTIASQKRGTWTEKRLTESLGIILFIRYTIQDFELGLPERGNSVYISNSNSSWRYPEVTERHSRRKWHSELFYKGHNIWRNSSPTRIEIQISNNIPTRSPEKGSWQSWEFRTNWRCEMIIRVRTVFI